MKRLTDWRPGQHVRLTEDCQSLSYPFVFMAGTEACLHNLERIQDGVEVWSLFVRTSVGRTMIGAPHTKLRLEAR